MQVLKLPAIAGLIWVSAGFRLLSKQALRMFSLVVIYFFFVLSIDLIALLLGQQFPEGSDARAWVPRVVTFCSGILSPVLLLGYMEACRDILRGERISPLYFLRGFQLPRPAFLALLAIGLFQVSALSILLSFLPIPEKFDFSDLSNAAAANQPPPDLDPHLLLVQCVTAALMLLIMVIVWYAPMLVAWHGMRVVKAMFFSAAACWRNKTAFIMYGVGWMIAGSFCFGLILLALSVFGSGALGSALVAIISLLMMGAMYCSAYVTYSSVFVTEAAPLDP